MIANVFMGDVTASRKYNSAVVQKYLAEVVRAANAAFAGRLLSPLTITLGDEFQGIANTTGTLVDLAFWFQTRCLEAQLPFDLHYSMVEGEVETVINRDIAHGMIGPALTRARELLTRKDRNRPKYQIVIRDETSGLVLHRLFSVLEALERRWKRKDDLFIAALLSGDGNQRLGERFDMDRSQVWKRRKTLLTDEVLELRAAILMIAAGKPAP